MSSLTLEQANRMITAALAEARQQGYKPMCVVVLDTAGDVKAMQREDGASMFRFDIARGKAWGAVAMGQSSRALLKRAGEVPHFFTALASVAQGRFIPQTGAVLIKDGDTLLGAMGASGGTGDEDEAICIRGIAAAGLSHA
jgi:uncharacterized protein GlcG (DUF336 family)